MAPLYFPLPGDRRWPHLSEEYVRALDAEDARRAELWRTGGVRDTPASKGDAHLPPEYGAVLPPVIRPPEYARLRRLVDPVTKQEQVEWTDAGWHFWPGTGTPAVEGTPPEMVPEMLWLPREWPGPLPDPEPTGRFRKRTPDVEMLWNEACDAFLARVRWSANQATIVLEPGQVEPT